LRVGTLLEGSVRREGNALRGHGAAHQRQRRLPPLVEDLRPGALKGIFALEDEIARNIADALQRKLVPVKQATGNTEAHDLYLRGRYLWNKRSREAIRQAAGYFQQAIREDPGYALAYAGLADALALQYDYEIPPVASVAAEGEAGGAESARSRSAAGGGPRFSRPRRPATATTSRGRSKSSAPRWSSSPTTGWRANGSQTSW